MRAFWSGTVAEFLAQDRAALVARLVDEQARRHRINELAQRRAWIAQCAMLDAALRASDAAAQWHLLLEYPLLRLGRRIDAVLLTDRLILVLEFKIGAAGFAADDLRQVEDYALDLQDFHAGSRRHDIVPILVAEHAPMRSAQPPLLLGMAVSPPVLTNAASLPAIITELQQAAPPPTTPLTSDWESAAYKPVPTIVEAARMLYGRHGVQDIAAARADLPNLRATTAAILAGVVAAREGGHHVVMFVTGIPGAGKTLCGLNVAFGIEHLSGATFLTGNPTLVHVLREALVRDAGASAAARRVARQRVEAAIQELPRFRDDNLQRSTPTHEHVIIIDEAQRSWRGDHAVRKSRDRVVQLTDSEPACLLDIMARHADWAAIICLVGGGQEIHTGEGGLAEWGVALAARPRWQVLAAPDVLHHADPRQRLPEMPALRTHPSLHLDVPARSIRADHAASWVDAVLRGDADAARAIAEGATAELPFLLTRSLAALQTHLRAAARGTRRAGLVGSSGAARLRAEGLGVELPHMEAGEVARWFLDRWPDVRASDALEVFASEFSCQGLELDFVGLCWGGDLIRSAGAAAWQARRFSGTSWQICRQEEAIANRRNTYRVLLTRARYATVIWVPPGSSQDITRLPAEGDAIAAFLLRCGARPLPARAPAAVTPVPMAGTLL